jgi:hypothetical protein
MTATHSEGPLRVLGTNLAKGVALGLFVATGLSLFVTVLRVGSGPGPFQRLDTTYPLTVALYYGAGFVGGILIGLAWPLKRWLLGSALLGMLGVFPAYLGAAFLMSPPSQWLTGDNFAEAALLALMVGVPVGAWSWLDDNEPPPWIQALLNPTALTIAVAWVLCLALSGGSYFFLSRWTGNWPFVLTILTVIGLFVVPIGVALFTTLQFVRQHASGRGRAA